MSLVIGLAGIRPGVPSAMAPTVSFDDDENGGYYWFFHPFFERLAHETRQYIDLYGVAEFRGDHLQFLRQILLDARELVASQPERWPVHVGSATMPNAPIPPRAQEVYKEVHRSALLSLLDSLLDLVHRSLKTGLPVVCLGD